MYKNFTSPLDNEQVLEMVIELQYSQLEEPDQLTTITSISLLQMVKHRSLKVSCQEIEPPTEQ